jgi:GH15 family glucan-1,4-alpha-glucosidase
LSRPIEDYALIGNRATAALVAIDGSIDWMCLPRFDSEAVFAALLGTKENGRWLIAPATDKVQTRRRYRDGTLILETEFETAEGLIVLTDAMQRRNWVGDLIRVVRCERGRVRMRMERCIRFGYGDVVPWVTSLPDGRLRAVAGPFQMVLQSSVDQRGEDLITVADFEIAEGEELPFSLSWNHSFRPVPEPLDTLQALRDIEREWGEWSGKCVDAGEYSDAVRRSLITLRALEDFDTGGIVAAPTTSLPEVIGGKRNWDYRYCWLRDSTLTLYALIESGYQEEADAWRDWLMRAIAGSPDRMQIAYGVAGERDLIEIELNHLSGYMGSKPVRIGNAAARQLQLDVFGELIDSFYQARRAGIDAGHSIWSLELAVIGHLESIWREPDEGIWEVRGGRRHFTWSKVMAWVAFDRAVRTMEEFGEEGPIERLRSARNDVRREVEEHGFDAEINSFVQYFGSKDLDASLLLIPLVGFIDPRDPRAIGTVSAIERNLMRDGFVQRYRPESGVDGIRDPEGVFLACTFWLADNYVLQGRIDEAKNLYERLLGLCNDVGLLPEEYDPDRKRFLGNFPQAFSHVALVNTAFNLTRARKPARHRSKISRRDLRQKTP